MYKTHDEMILVLKRKGLGSPSGTMAAQKLEDSCFSFKKLPEIIQGAGKVLLLQK